MISKQAAHLLHKIKSLKNEEQVGKKMLKENVYGMIEYESKFKKWAAKFDFEVSDLEREYKEFSHSQRKQEKEAIQQIDNYELTLRNLLDNYQRQSLKANQKLAVMVSSIKEEMQASIKHNNKHEKASLSKYNKMSERLEKMIELVREKQKKSIDSYEAVKDVIRDKAGVVSESNQHFIQSVSVQTQKLMEQLCRLQQMMDQELCKHEKRYDQKVYEVNKVINLMVQHQTNL